MRVVNVLGQILMYSGSVQMDFIVDKTDMINK